MTDGRIKASARTQLFMQDEARSGALNAQELESGQFLKRCLVQSSSTTQATTNSELASLGLRHPETQAF